MHNLQELLLANGGVQRSNYIQFSCPNPAHEDVHPSATYYLDRDYWKCFACHQSGKGSDLYQKLTNMNTQYHNQVSNNMSDWPVVEDDYVNQCHKQVIDSVEQTGDNRGWVYWHKIRGINRDSIEYFKLGYDKKYQCATIPGYFCGKLCAIKMRFLSAEKQRYSYAANGRRLLYGWDRANTVSLRRLMIMEGEIDCISSYVLEPRLPCVATGGVTNWSDQWTELLETKPNVAPYEKIYIGFDDDKAGNTNAEKLAEILGPDRCYRFKLEGYKDLNELLTSKKPITEIRDIYWTALKNATRMGTPLISTLEEDETKIRAYNSYFNLANRGLSSGFPAIDEIFGGFRPNELTVLCANTGAGKTTLCAGIIKHFITEHQISTLVGSFEDPFPEKIIPKLLSFVGKKNIELYTQRLKEAEYIELYKKLQNVQFINRTSTTPIEEIEEAIRTAYRNDINFVVLDHLHFFIDSADERTDIAHAMKTLTNLKNELPGLMLLLVVHPRNLQKDETIITINHLHGSSEIKKQADNILLINQDEDGYYIECGKVRSASVTTPLHTKKRYVFDKHTYEYTFNHF